MYLEPQLMTFLMFLLLIQQQEKYYLLLMLALALKLKYLLTVLEVMLEMFLQLIGFTQKLMVLKFQIKLLNSKTLT